MCTTVAATVSSQLVESNFEPVSSASQHISALVVTLLLDNHLQTPIIRDVLIHFHKYFDASGT